MNSEDGKNAASRLRGHNMLTAQIYNDFIKARKAKDEQKTLALQVIWSVVKNEQIEKHQDLTDEEMVRLLQKEAKKREEAIALYKQGNRQDLVDKESFELNLIKSYLPMPMSREKIAAIIDLVLNSGIDKSNFGQVMQAVMKELAGKADGKQVSEMVREKLK
jgi:uncharacterized protein